MGASDTFKVLSSDELGTFLKDIPSELVVRGVQSSARSLFVRYFKGYRVQTASKRVREMVENEVVAKGNEELAQLFTTLWNRANGRLYHSVYNKVRTVNEDVHKIELIEDDKADVFLTDLLKEFDAARVYLCILLNEVKFSKEMVQKHIGKAIPIVPWPPALPLPEEEEGAETPGADAGKTSDPASDAAPAGAADTSAAAPEAAPAGAVDTSAAAPEAAAAGAVDTSAAAPEAAAAGAGKADEPKQ